MPTKNPKTPVSSSDVERVCIHGLVSSQVANARVQTKPPNPKQYTLYPKPNNSHTPHPSYRTTPLAICADAGSASPPSATVIPLAGCGSYGGGVGSLARSSSYGGNGTSLLIVPVYGGGLYAYSLRARFGRCCCIFFARCFRARRNNAPSANATTKMLMVITTRRMMAFSGSDEDESRAEIMRGMRCLVGRLLMLIGLAMTRGIMQRSMRENWARVGEGILCGSGWLIMLVWSMARG